MKLTASPGRRDLLAEFGDEKIEPVKLDGLVDVFDCFRAGHGKLCWLIDLRIGNLTGAAPRPLYSDFQPGKASQANDPGL